MSPATNRLLRVVTRCATRAEFLSTFDRFVDESSVFVATHQPRPVGARLPFAIALKDGEAVLKGEGEVIESHLEKAGSMRRPGMRLRLLRLDGPSKEIHQELLDRKRHAAVTIAHPPPPPAAALAPRNVPGAPDKTAGGSAQPVETRAPSSSFVVPANPFGELPPEALEYFIECTLYEEAMAQPEAAEPPVPVAVPVAISGASSAPPISLPVVPVPLPPPPSLPGAPPEATAMMRLTPPVEVPVRRDVLPARRAGGLIAMMAGIVGAGLGLAGGYALWASPSLGIRAVQLDPSKFSAEPAPAPPEAKPADPAPAPPPEPTAVVADPNPTPTPTPTPTATTPPAQAPAPADPTPAPVEEPTPAPAPAPAPAVAAAAIEKTAAVEPEPPAADGTCRLAVETLPPEALVRVAGGGPARRTPAQLTVPCGPVALVIEHPRYQRVERTVQATSAATARIAERLVRPRGVVTLRSSPPGASFSVNGAPVGRAPAKAPVNAFTTITVRANLDGYQPWTDRIYVRGTDAQISASLEAPGRTSSRTTRTARPPRRGTPDL